MLLYQIVQTAYWLALATWFGGVLFIALSAPVVFRTVRERDPVMPDVLSVNLEGQHATLLAGSIVGNLLNRLSSVQLICAAVILLMMLVQPLVIDTSWQRPAGAGYGTAAPGLFATVRAVLFLAAAALVIYDWRWVWPRIVEQRERYIRHADEPEIANAAREQFDRAHRQSVNLLSAVLFLLLGLIVFSAPITPDPALLAPHIPIAE